LYEKEYDNKYHPASPFAIISPFYYLDGRGSPASSLPEDVDINDDDDDDKKGECVTSSSWCDIIRAMFLWECFGTVGFAFTFYVDSGGRELFTVAEWERSSFFI
jgi:hypothetical protein